ncbi:MULTISPECIES: BON domain-containing protein [Clostridium]|jgi:osmotically-inducible protein OsmY|uniref:BON domain-containing protein n=1 Tax=Clostridium TaxID=1485 RepID=UPI0002898709|nr:MULTISPECIES: BON domain-containing protein [Clostridium]MDF2503463.1 putative periplasmic or secreted lipoprotein [Clostridium sp.]
MNVNDRLMEDAIRSSLASAMKVTSKDIKVRSLNGIVSLQGFVNVLAEKNRAEEVAYKIEGVKEVKNDITISLDGGESDKELTNLVNSNLRNSAFKNRILSVTAKVSGGNAILIGDVETERDRQIAISEANKTFGVRSVVSSINLASFKDDTSLTNDINMLLMESKINVNDISAVVLRGKVSISGYAEKEEDINKLVTLVQSIPGIKEVNNKLKLYKIGTGIS